MPTTTKTPAEQLERANRAVLLWSQTPRNQYSTELCDMLGESLRAALEQLDAARAARQAAQRDLEQAQAERNRARLQGEMDARRTPPPGFLLVPIEPTAQMLGAAADLSTKVLHPCGIEYWRAMVSAAAPADTAAQEQQP